MKSLDIVLVFNTKLKSDNKLELHVPQCPDTIHMPKWIMPSRRTADGTTIFPCPYDYSLTGLINNLYNYHLHITTETI